MTKKNALTIIHILKELSVEMKIDGYALRQNPSNDKKDILTYLWDLIHYVNEEMPVGWIFLSSWLYCISRPLKNV